MAASFYGRSRLPFASPQNSLNPPLQLPGATQAAADLSCSSNKSLRPWQCPFKEVQGCRLPALKTPKTLPCSSQAPLRPRQTFPVAITILSAMISLSLYRTTPNRGVGGTRALAHSIIELEKMGLHQSNPSFQQLQATKKAATAAHGVSLRAPVLCLLVPWPVVMGCWVDRWVDKNF